MVLSAPPVADAPETVPLGTGARGRYRFAFRAMGTHCQVQFHAPTRAAAGGFRDDTVAWLRAFELKYSRYRPDSLISQINHGAGKHWVDTDAELDSMLTLCDGFFWRTGGLFDPSALPLLRLWDYQAENPVVPPDAAVQEARRLVGWERVRRQSGRIYLPRPGMALDLGGLGKEYAVDRVFERARRRGMEHLLVDFGSDLRVHGEPPEGGPWRIGLEHPLDPGKCWGGVSVQDRAVVTSGDYLRGFQVSGKRYGHILNPRTGYPVRNGCRAVSVIAPTCTEAGVLATTAFILGEEEGLALLQSSHHAEGCIWTQQHRFETGRFHEYVI